MFMNNEIKFGRLCTTVWAKGEVRHLLPGCSSKWLYSSVFLLTVLSALEECRKGSVETKSINHDPLSVL